ncbi:BF3164 family lipoprotein [Butyricimonas faecihominis]|uniref:BF3164 family lipoprotein n=1 Tax=Butyricimonas faecihominis TaxID=1472416 RepID=UPI0032C00F60
MRHIYLIFIIFTITSCQNSSIINIETIHVSDITECTGELLTNIHDGCYINGIIKDTFLCLQNECSEQLFHVYSTRSMNKLFEFGTKGRGPNEYIFPLFINTFDSKILSIHDLSLNRLTNIQLNNYPNKEAYSDTLLPPESINTYNLNILDSINIASSILNDSSLFYIYDKQFNIKAKINYEPRFFVSPKGNIHDAYSLTITSNSKQHSIIAVFKYLNLINFYDLNGHLQKSIELDLLKDKIDCSQFQLSEDMIVTSYNTYPTHDFCYILWQGVPVNRAYQSPCYILAFTWQGELKKTYRINLPLNYIIVDEENGYLIGSIYSEKTEFVELYKYQLQ